jgi:hypothetical protein
MFLKQKEAVPWLTFYDSDGNVAKKIRLMDLAVPEGIVIEKSIEFFHDPAPCMIHRTAVLSRLMMEIESALSSCTKAPLGSLPEEIRRYLSGYTDVHAISITQEDKG